MDMEIKRLENRIEHIERDILGRKPLTVSTPKRTSISNYKKQIPEEDGTYIPGKHYPLLFILTEEVGDTKGRGFEILGVVIDETNKLRIVNLFLCEIHCEDFELTSQILTCQ